MITESEVIELFCMINRLLQVFYVIMAKYKLTLPV